MIPYRNDWTEVETLELTVAEVLELFAERNAEKARREKSTIHQAKIKEIYVTSPEHLAWIVARTLNEGHNGKQFKDILRLP